MKFVRTGRGHKAGRNDGCEMDPSADDGWCGMKIPGMIGCWTVVVLEWVIGVVVVNATPSVTPEGTEVTVDRYSWSSKLTPGVVVHEHGHWSSGFRLLALLDRVRGVEVW